MKVQKKRRIAQKLLGRISLSINGFVMVLFLVKKNTALLSGGILLFIVSLWHSVSRTSYDKSVDDLSKISIIIEYIAVYIITFLSAFKVAEYLSSVAVLIVLTIFSIAELLAFLLITYWYSILRFFQKIRKLEKDG